MENYSPATNGKKISVLIADDHTLVRELWTLMLNSQPDMEVVAACSSGEEAIEKAKELRPDVVTMDINLPGINGIEATGQIRRFSPASKILGVSLHSQPAYAKRMMQKGALGYVTKNSTSSEMIEAIKEVAKGKKFICEEIKKNLCDAVIGEETANTGFHSLSAREIECIELIRQGFISKEIACTMQISNKTVEVHRYNILKKLNLKNTAALVNFINNQPEFAR